jgi:phosphoribosylformimino-5-aminoimidazole carboxamide ribotide isomerase
VQVEASFQSMEDIRTAFEGGASKVVLRPFAFSLIREAVKTYGPEKVIAEIQSKGSGVIGDGKTSDGEPIDVVDFAEKLVPLGIKEIVFKDERSEGTLMQPNYDEVDRLFLITGNDLKIYVSGGISDPKHLRLLKKIGAAGAIIGKAFFERTISIAEAQAAVRD